MGLFEDVVGGVVSGGTQVVNGTVNAASAVINATVEVAAAPTRIAIDIATGKPVDVEIKRLGDVVVDAVTATSVATNIPNFVAINLAKAVGGETGESIAIAATAGQVVAINLPAIIARKLNKGGDVSPQEIAAAPIDILLAAALESAAQQLVGSGKAIPDLIKIMLKPVFGQELLDEAKYVVGRLGLTLPELVNGYQDFMGNHAHAVTVPGVIVFSVEPDQSIAALRWWAHELGHVRQYKEMGVDEFARQYVRDYASLETEADSYANSVGTV